MKRIALLLILLLSLALALSACGGTAQAPEEPAEEPAATEPAEEPVEEPTEVMEEPTEEAPAEEPTEVMEEPTEEAPAEEPTEAAEEPAAMECTDELGCVEVAPGDPILLASALVISGPNASLGQDSQNGIEIALNLRPELLGHPVELQPEDDGCNAEGGQTSASKIVSNPQIVAMIGTSCSGAGVPAAEIISDAGYVMISPSNTSPDLGDPDVAWRPGYLRTAHNDLIQGAAMADFAFNELGVTQAAAIHDGDPYTEGLARSFSDAFEELGGTIVAFEAEASDATNVEPLLTTIAAAEPEFIFYPVFIQLGSLITNTAQNIPGLEDVALAAADGIQSPEFLENTADSSEGMYASGPDLSFENTFYQDEFLPMYQEMFGSEPTAPFHAHAFDATNMVLDAIEAVAQEGDDGTLLIGRQALRDALYATSGFEGITGTLACDEFGECANAQISVSQVQSGEFVRIWPEETE
jgi:branched-chain amino acid transport system substrate-binding protein